MPSFVLLALVLLQATTSVSIPLFILIASHSSFLTTYHPTLQAVNHHYQTRFYDNHQAH